MTDGIIGKWVKTTDDRHDGRTGRVEALMQSGSLLLSAPDGELFTVWAESCRIVPEPKPEQTREVVKPAAMRVLGVNEFGTVTKDTFGANVSNQPPPFRWPWQRRP